LRQDEHPRPDTTTDMLGKLKGVVRPDGSVTAGKCLRRQRWRLRHLAGIGNRCQRHGLTPRARVLGMATAGLAPRIMGFGPSPASRKVLALTGLRLDQMDVIELNEAFAAQALAVTRDLGLADDAAHVNPNGGAIAIGHPLGASGARLIMTALHQLERTKAVTRCAPCASASVRASPSSSSASDIAVTHAGTTPRAHLCFRSSILIPFLPAMTDHQDILISHPAPHVMLITLNRPQVRNALRNNTLREIAGVLSALDTDDSVRVVVITGDHKALPPRDINEMERRPD